MITRFGTGIYFNRVKTSVNILPLIFTQEVILRQTLLSLTVMATFDQVALPEVYLRYRAGIGQV